MPVRVVNTHEAKSRLSELIRDAEAGLEVIVARNGHAVAKIIPWPPNRPARVPGAWAGRVEYHDDIVNPDPDIAAMFDESASSTVK
jgi:antitoxin (DNA-binding transcriptional repressor) of toxin-antitoxin stability system